MALIDLHPVAADVIIISVPTLSTSPSIWQMYVSTVVTSLASNDSAYDDGNADDEADEMGSNNWLALLLFIIVIAAIGGNVLVCLAVCCKPKLQNMFNYFLVSLALSDMLSATLVMPLSIIKASIVSAKRMILEFMRKSMNSNGVKVDVNCQELRTIIPTIIQQLVYNGDCSVTKVRGKYSHRPVGWNVSVPFVDPNNKPKPGKEVLIEMTHELIRLFRIQQQETFGDQTGFEDRVNEILDQMSGPYSVERLESLVPLLLNVISEQRQDPYKNSLTEAFEDWKKGNKVDSGPNNSEIDVRDVQQMSDEMEYSPGTSSSGLQNTMEDRVNVGMLQGHMMEVQQHNTTAEYRSNIRIAEDKREIADCVKSLDISFDQENICNLKRDDDDDEHIPPRPKKQKLDRRATSTIKVEQMSSMDDAPESQPHEHTSIGSSYQLPLAVEMFNDEIDADNRTDINLTSAIEQSVVFGGAAATTSTTEATFNFSEWPQLSLWDDLPELSSDYVDNFLSRSLERTDP